MLKRTWFKIVSSGETSYLNADFITNVEIDEAHGNAVIYTSDIRAACSVVKLADAAELLEYLDQRIEVENGSWQAAMRQIVHLADQARKERDAASMEGAHRA